MRLAFTAREVGTDDEYAIVAGVRGADTAGDEHYLLFQRDAEDSDDDWGIHLEYDDQANGDYGRIRKCRLSRRALVVELSGPLGDLEGVEGFDVDLEAEEGAYATFATRLRLIFRGCTELLEIDEANGP